MMEHVITKNIEKINVSRLLNNIHCRLPSTLDFKDEDAFIKDICLHGFSYDLETIRNIKENTAPYSTKRSNESDLDFLKNVL